MNVPAIRAALLRLKAEHAIRHESDKSIAYMDALVRVGLRACESMDKGALTYDEAVQLRVIADILRESGVEVSE